SEPYASAPTASRTINGVTVRARHIGTGAAHSRVSLSTGGFRTNTATTSFDQYGQPVQVDDGGDDADPNDQQCTKTDYAYNTTAWLISFPTQVRTFAVACSQATDANLPNLTDN